MIRIAKLKTSRIREIYLDISEETGLALSLLFIQAFHFD